MKMPGLETFSFLLLTFSLALSPTPAAQLNWKKISGPEGGDIQGLTASGDTVVAVTAQGDYYRSVDGGKTWSLLYRSLVLEYDTYGEWVPQPLFLGDQILGSAAQGGALIFQGGRTDRFMPVIENHFQTFRPTYYHSQGNQLFALSNAIYVSKDRGKTWTAQVEMLGDRGPISALAGDGSSLYAMNGGTELYASHDQGQTWSLIRHVPGRGSAFGDLVGMPGALVAWWQGGEVLSLSRQGDSLTADSARLPGQGPWTVRYAGSKLLASGSMGISTSSDRGITWNSLTHAPPHPIQTIVELPNGDFLAGTREGIYKWNRNTGQWSPSQAGLAAVEIRYLMKQGQSLLALGPRSLHRSPDGGGTWQRIYTPAVSAFTKMDLVSPDVFVFDDSGRIFPVGPGDSLGHDIASEFPASPLDLGRSGNHWFFMAANGVVHISHDNRATWTSLSSNNYHWRARMAVQGSRIIMQGPNDSLRYSQDTGHTWKVVRSPSRFFAPMAISGDAWLVMGENIFRSEDPSAGWKAISLDPSGAMSQNLVGNGKTLYAAADIGLYASEDHGETWSILLTGMMRGEYETLKTGPSALFAKAESGAWWVTGLEEVSSTQIGIHQSPINFRRSRTFSFDRRLGHAAWGIRLDTHTQLPGRVIDLNGRKIVPYR